MDTKSKNHPISREGKFLGKIVALSRVVGEGSAHRKEVRVSALPAGGISTGRSIPIMLELRWQQGSNLSVTKHQLPSPASWRTRQLWGGAIASQLRGTAEGCLHKPACISQDFPGKQNQEHVYLCTKRLILRNWLLGLGEPVNTKSAVWASRLET